MEVTSLIGRPVKILTIDEYKEAIKEYYTTSGNSGEFSVMLGVMP